MMVDWFIMTASTVSIFNRFIMLISWKDMWDPQFNRYGQSANMFHVKFSYIWPAKVWTDFNYLDWWLGWKPFQSYAIPASILIASDESSACESDCLH